MVLYTLITDSEPPNVSPCVPGSPTSSTMRSACLSLLLVTACWALPFHQSGFLDFMMEDEPGSGDEVDKLERPPKVDPALPPEPKCPFRCQCHLRVVQCSDLGKHFKLNHKLSLNTTPPLPLGLFFFIFFCVGKQKEALTTPLFTFPLLCCSFISGESIVKLSQTNTPIQV